MFVCRDTDYCALFDAPSVETLYGTAAHDDGGAKFLYRYVLRVVLNFWYTFVIGCLAGVRLMRS